MAEVSKSAIELFFEHGLHSPSRAIYLGDCFGEIEDGAASEFIKAIHVLEINLEEPITVILNSCGGDAYCSLAIYDAIRTCGCPVSIYAYGACMSGASIIMQAGALRVLSKYTVFMLHDGETGSYGHPKAVENWGDFSKKHYRKFMYEIYYKKMKEKNKSVTMKTVEDLCTHDTILTAKQAVDFGLADEVI